MFVYTIYIVNFWSWAKQSNPNFPFVCKKYFGLDNFELILNIKWSGKWCGCSRWFCRYTNIIKTLRCLFNLSHCLWLPNKEFFATSYRHDLEILLETGTPRLIDYNFCEWSNSKIVLSVCRLGNSFERIWSRRLFFLLDMNSKRRMEA